MAKNNNLTDFLTDIANTIRTQKGTTAKINPQNFSSEIAGLSYGMAYHFEMITANKTWVCPSNIASKVCVRVFGGGGGGHTGYAISTSGYTEYGGGGGGGGHMAYGEFDIKGGTSINVTIGDGGGNNINGKASSFGSYLSANGGAMGNYQHGGDGGSGGGGGGISAYNDSSDKISNGGKGSYGGDGAKGCYRGDITLENGKNGINTTSINNPKLIKGNGAGGKSVSYQENRISGGGGGGYGGAGGNGASTSMYAGGGGGGGGYGGAGGDGGTNYTTGKAGTGYASGGGGGGCDSSSDEKGGAGAKGVVLVSYLTKVKKEPLYPI